MTLMARESKISILGEMVNLQVVNLPMDQRTFKNANNFLNTNIYSYLETSGGQSSNLNLNVVHIFNTRVN